MATPDLPPRPELIAQQAEIFRRHARTVAEFGDHILEYPGEGPEPYRATVRQALLISKGMAAQDPEMLYTIVSMTAEPPPESR